MITRLTMKEKLELQAAYIKQLEKVKEEYDSLKEFIFRHMCSMIPEDEKGEYIHDYVFNRLSIGDLLLCRNDFYESGELLFEEDKYYTVHERSTTLITMQNEIGNGTHYSKIILPLYFTLIRQLNRPIQVGDKLVAINPCIMSVSGTPALNVGQEYEIINVRKDTISIKSNAGRDHQFYFSDILSYFIQK